MVQSYKSGQVFQVGLKFVKIFWACIRNFFITPRVFFFFFSFVTYVCCAHHGNFCEWSDYDFFSANSGCKHSCILLLSARISLTLLEKVTAVRKWAHCVKKINHTILGLFLEAYKLAFHVRSAILESFSFMSIGPS